MGGTPSTDTFGGTGRIRSWRRWNGAGTAEGQPEDRPGYRSSDAWALRN